MGCVIVATLNLYQICRCTLNNILINQYIPFDLPSLVMLGNIHPWLIILYRVHIIVVWKGRRHSASFVLQGVSDGVCHLTLSHFPLDHTCHSTYQIAVSVNDQTHMLLSPFMFQHQWLQHSGSIFNIKQNFTFLINISQYVLLFHRCQLNY